MRFLYIIFIFALISAISSCGTIHGAMQGLGDDFVNLLNI